MADDNWWPMQILIKCPNQIVRQVTGDGTASARFKPSHLHWSSLSGDRTLLLTSPSVLQMFQRLCIHVIQRLRPVHAHLYLQPGMEDR